MKKLIVTTMMFFAIGTAYAQMGAEALPSTLASTMKAMSRNLKTVVAQAKDPQMNASSADLADQFVQLTLHGKDFVPDSIASLPADQQPAAKAEYEKVLDQAADLGRQLAAAFRSNDSALVANLLNQLAQIKKNGHSIFNP
jgi:hypothetical protein